MALHNHHDPDTPTAPEPPGGLSSEQELIWRQVARPDHTPGDRPMLLLTVQWYALAKRLLDQAHATPDDLGRVNAAVTASTCLIRFSEKLGLSAADRKSLGVVDAKPVKPTGRPKRLLDDLNPKALGIPPYTPKGA